MNLDQAEGGTSPPPATDGPPGGQSNPNLDPDLPSEPEDMEEEGMTSSEIRASFQSLQTAMQAIMATFLAAQSGQATAQPGPAPGRQAPAGQANAGQAPPARGPAPTRQRHFETGGPSTQPATYATAAAAPVSSQKSPQPAQWTGSDIGTKLPRGRIWLDLVEQYCVLVNWSFVTVFGFFLASNAAEWFVNLRQSIAYAGQELTHGVLKAEFLDFF